MDIIRIEVDIPNIKYVIEQEIVNYFTFTIIL